MAFKQQYAVLTDIPEAFREHYTEKDGLWLIQTDPPQEDVSGLKSALGAERDLRRKTEVQLTEWKSRFEGIDPDEVAKLRERVKGFDDAEIYDRQGIEALVTRRTENMKTDHERVVGAKNREIGQLKGKVDEMTQRWKGDRIQTALLEAATLAGVDKQAVRDAVSRGREVFNDLNEHGAVVARDPTDATGQTVQYGKDGINPLSPNEFYLNLKASGQAAHLWGTSTGSGAPPHHGGNGVGVDWNSIKDPVERLTRFREWQSGQASR